MKAILRIFLILFFFSSLAFAQLYQGPAAGSVASGVTVTTGTFNDMAGQSTEKFHIPRNIFSYSYVQDTPEMPAATGPIGSNYVEDPNFVGEPSRLNGDFVLVNDFQGIPDQGFYIPPDPYIAVGPNHIMALVNSRFRIYTKTGTIQATISANSWYASALPGADPFDPKVIYDHFAQRWVMVWLHWVGSSSYYLVSVSDDSDPNGTWHNWAINATLNGSSPAGNGADYQGVGYDQDAIYITSNQFSNSTGSFDYVKIRILNKTDLYAGTAGVLNWQDLWNIKEPSASFTVFGTRPARVYGTPGEFYLVSRSPYVTGTFFTLHKLINATTTPSITAVNVPVAAYLDPDDPQQLGSAQTLEGGGSNIRNEPVYRDGLLHMVHSVKSGTGGAYSAVRYVAFDVASNTAVSDVAMGLDGYFHYYTALDVDQNGNVAFTYSRSSSTEYAGAYWTSKPTTSLTLTGSQLLKAGSGSYYKTFGSGRNRWGDYMGAWLDPANPDNIWILCEYVSSTNMWGTWIGELEFTEFSTYVTVTAPDGGENLTIGNNFDIEWSSENVTDVNIEYSTDNGSSWNSIVNNVTASAGFYTWTVPNTPSSQCLIGIYDSSDPLIRDESNGNFIISSGFDWMTVNSGTLGEIWGIDFVDQNIVWICADNGDVKRSTDGGFTWIDAGSVVQACYSIAAIDELTAVVATGPASGNGTIKKTTDGGGTWTQVYTATGAWFNFIDNISSTVLWAQSDPTATTFHIVKSTDGGSTWALAANNPTAPTNVFGANSSFYRINNTCWFGTGGQTGATQANRVYKSTNGPDGPWTYATTSDQYTGSLAFSSETGAGLVGFWQSPNIVNRSTDGGNTWTSHTFTGLADVKGLEYVHGTSHAWSATASGLWHTTDDGLTWTADQIPTGITAGLSSVRFYGDANIGLAGGPGGVLLKSLNDPVVPVELTSFTAVQVGNYINLEWTTATESNNLGFEIERKVSKNNQTGNWNVIAFKSGHGTSTEPMTYNYSDDISSVSAGTISYRLKQIDYDGSFEYFEAVQIESVTPLNYQLSQNYPNPFNPVTTISFAIPEPQQVKLFVYNSLGEKVAELVNNKLEAGRYNIEFSGEKIASGVYFYTLQAGEFTATKKLMLLK